MRNTIQDMILTSGRRTGKSIRQIDRAVQILFEDGKVQILDHHENGTHKAANEILFKRVLKRLESEHSIGKHRIFSGDIDTFIIRLINL